MNILLMLIGYLFGTRVKKQHDFSHIDKPTIFKDSRPICNDQQLEYKIYINYQKNGK